jgi:cytochrome c556
MKRLITIGLVAALTVSAGASFAAEPAPPSPEQQAKSAVETRQGLFKLISYNFGPVGGMMRDRVPFDAAVVARNSARIESLAGMIPELYQNDTRKFHQSVKTAALDGIWTSQADFKTKADALSTAAAKLTAAAKGGDQKATLAAAAEVGKACGSCHDSYRAKAQ